MDSGSSLNARYETERSIRVATSKIQNASSGPVISPREAAIETRGQHAEQDIASKRALDEENRKWV